MVAQTIKLTNGSELKHFKMIYLIASLQNKLTYSKTPSKTNPAVILLFTHNSLTHIKAYFLHNTYHYMKCSC